MPDFKTPEVKKESGESEGSSEGGKVSDEVWLGGVGDWRVGVGGEVLSGTGLEEVGHTVGRVRLSPVRNYFNSKVYPDS